MNKENKEKTPIRELFIKHKDIFKKHFEEQLIEREKKLKGKK